MTPYYQDDAVTLYHGDCEEVLSALAVSHSARVITDPPYGTGAYKTDIAPDVRLLAEWGQKFPTFALFGYPETLVAWCIGMNLQPSEWVTWWPTNKALARTKLLSRESEHVAIFGEVVGAKRLVRPRRGDGANMAAARGLSVEARMGDVWQDVSPGAGANWHLRNHANEKPLSLMRRLVELCSNPSELVLDPFAGSGTTLRAAKDLGRQAIGIEIEERDCEIAAQRCAQEVLVAA